MPHAPEYSRIRQLATRATDTLRRTDWRLDQIDPDGLRYVATMSARGHWFIVAVLLFELAYRPYLGFGVGRYTTYVLLLGLLIGFNGYLHYRLLSNRPITWHWLLGLYALDVVLLSAAAALSNGFDHDFLHLFYYPALSGMAVLFTSFRFNMAWVTMASLVYVAISLTVADGISIETGDENVDRQGH